MAAEDTRHTRNRLTIMTLRLSLSPIMHNRYERGRELVGRITDGLRVALVRCRYARLSHVYQRMALPRDAFAAGEAVGCSRGDRIDYYSYCDYNSYGAGGSRQWACSGKKCGCGPDADAGCIVGSLCLQEWLSPPVMQVLYAGRIGGGAETEVIMKY